MLTGLYIMNPAEWERIYPTELQAELAKSVEMLAPVLSPAEALARPDLLERADILVSGWGGPVLDESFLARAPRLKAFFYGAGAVGHLLTETSAQRKIIVTTANSINGIPVAEFSLAHILLGLKRASQQARETKKQRAFLHPPLPVAGSYQSTVGLISLSTIGRQVLQHLKHFDVKVIAYDPTLKQGIFDGAELVTLEELFARSDVVSLHAPLIPQTVGLVTGPLLASMKNGATFINTARGSIVRENEMIEVLRARPDLTAVLDVTDPEPPLPTCPLFDLPNAVVTPHIAGSLDRECARMGRWIVDEIQRYRAGEPLRGLFVGTR
jgi:phosphoglycerate dehydrogenase-like enzyme